MVTIIVYYFFGSVIRAKKTFLTYEEKRPTCPNYQQFNRSFTGVKCRPTSVA